MNIEIENCRVINSYKISVDNGALVRDEELTALAAAGYVIVPREPTEAVYKAVNGNSYAIDAYETIIRALAR